MGISEPRCNLMGSPHLMHGPSPIESSLGDTVSRQTTHSISAIFFFELAVSSCWSLHWQLHKSLQVCREWCFGCFWNAGFDTVLDGPYSFSPQHPLLSTGGSLMVFLFWTANIWPVPSSPSQYLFQLGLGTQSELDPTQ